MDTLSPAATRFMAKRPTFIGGCAGFRFYEHPVYGDEHPLVAITPNGRVVHTAFFDLPSLDEVLGWRD